MRKLTHFEAQGVSGGHEITSIVGFFTGFGAIVGAAGVEAVKYFCKDSGEIRVS